MAFAKLLFLPTQVYKKRPSQYLFLYVILLLYYLLKMPANILFLTFFFYLKKNKSIYYIHIFNTLSLILFICSRKNLDSSTRCRYVIQHFSCSVIHLYYFLNVREIYYRLFSLRLCIFFQYTVFFHLIRIFSDDDSFDF